MIAVRALLTSLLLLTPALGAEWLCVPDQATGFKWIDGAWQDVTFDTPHTYLIKEVPEYELGGMFVALEVTQIGRANPTHRCPPIVGEQVACGGLGMGFVFNRATLRYQEYYGFGYVDGGDSPENTPAIEIGKCSPLS